MNEQQNDKGREFLLSQFHAIREEILALKERVIRIQTIAISGIPLLVAAGERLNLDFVVIVSPIITTVVVLMLSFEQNSIMRAGRYIRKYIEPKLKPNDIICWEDFLEKQGEENRNAERYFLLSVITAFSLYYIGGGILAYIKIKNYTHYGNALSIALAIFYGCILPFFIYFVVRNFKTSTGTD